MWMYVLPPLSILILLKALNKFLNVGKYGERYVFITGCDTGFGYLLAKKLDSLGFNVFAGCFTERGADELGNVSSARLKTLSLDVTNIESIVKAREFVERHLPPEKGLWAIVNNAGVMSTFAVTEMLPREDYEKCISVNLYGTIDVTRVFQPLVRKGQGRIVNMSSIGGRISIGSAAYAASKYGVEAFSDCLRRESLKHGITVHIIEPTGFQTNLINMDNVRIDMEKAFQSASPDVQNLYGENYVEELYEDFEAHLGLISKQTYKVVDAYIHAITAMFPKYRYLVGSEATLFWILWNLPEWMTDPLLARLIPLPGSKQLIHC